MPLLPLRCRFAAIAAVAAVAVAVLLPLSAVATDQSDDDAVD